MHKTGKYMAIPYSGILDEPQISAEEDLGIVGEDPSHQKVIGNTFARHPKKHNLQEMLDQITPESQHGEAWSTPSRGREF